MPFQSYYIGKSKKYNNSSVGNSTKKRNISCLIGKDKNCYKPTKSG